MTIAHEQISKRAREIWEREGRPEGRDKEHWLQAEAELHEESSKGQNDQNGQNFSAHENGMLNVQAGSNREEGRKRGARRGKP
jgi:hypothetical protein